MRGHSIGSSRALPVLRIMGMRHDHDGKAVVKTIYSNGAKRRNIIVLYCSIWKKALNGACACWQGHQHLHQYGGIRAVRRARCSRGRRCVFAVGESSTG